MTKKCYTLPTEMSSKADEIAFLEKLINDLLEAGQTYSASLLNKNLFDWARYQIRNDLGCDIFGALVYELETVATLHGETADLRREIEVFSTRYDERIKLYEERIKQYEDRIEAQKSNNNFISEQFEKWRDIAEQRYAEAVEAQRQVQDLELAVIRLKAKLYDLEVTK